MGRSYADIINARIKLPFSLQDISVPNGQLMPIDRAPLTEYKQGVSVSFGTGTPFTHTVNGSKLGIGVHWETSTPWSIDVAYIVPGTTNVLMSPYVQVASGTSDGDVVVIDTKNKYARIRINNDSADTNATIDTVSVVDL